MSTIPPDPYTLKAVEAATKTAIELLHEDVKAGLSELLRIVKERGAEQATKNAENFGLALEEELSHRINIGIPPSGYARITGSINDPDFAYIVAQATIASARTSDKEKHRLLARAVTERLMAEPGGILALTSSLACEIIPNLTSRQLLFLGLASGVKSIRPNITDDDVHRMDEKTQQEYYLGWLNHTLVAFRPFPDMKEFDYDHLRGMACIDMLQLGISWERILAPKNLPSFTWPEGFLESNEVIQELKEVKGLTSCSLTTVGAVIGTSVRDIKTGSSPTVFPDWE